MWFLLTSSVGCKRKAISKHLFKKCLEKYNCQWFTRTVIHSWLMKWLLNWAFYIRIMFYATLWLSNIQKLPFYFLNVEYLLERDESCSFVDFLRLGNSLSCGQIFAFRWRSARTDVGLCWSLLWNTYFQIFKTALISLKRTRKTLTVIFVRFLNRKQ